MMWIYTNLIGGASEPERTIRASIFPEAKTGCGYTMRKCFTMLRDCLALSLMLDQP